MNQTAKFKQWVAELSDNVKLEYNGHDYGTRWEPLDLSRIRAVSTIPGLVEEKEAEVRP